MIPKAYITEWRNAVSWSSDAQVEQDLIISRFISELFSNDLIAQNLLFRGGTSLYKLFSSKPARYSEDIDLVQITALPIGDVMTEIRKVCERIMPPDGYKQSSGRVVLYYKAESEIPPIMPMKVKIEINTREHFSVYDIDHKKFEVNSRWFSSSISVPTYQIEELLGTKLRALYQRKKGRDLFDLWYAIKNMKLDYEKIIHSFKEYIKHQGVRISSKQYTQNLNNKMKDNQFTHDMDNLIYPNIDYSIEQGYDLVKSTLVELI